MLDAAERLFTQEDVDRVSIDEIVSEANVAKGTFYNHFNDRTELFHALIHDVRAELRAQILRETRAVDDPARKTARAFFLALRYRILNPRRAPLVAASHSPSISVSDDINANIAKRVSEGVACGRFRIASDAGVLLLFGMVGISFKAPLDHSDPGTTIALVQQLGAGLLRGLGLAHEEAESMAAEETDLIIRPVLNHDPSGDEMNKRGWLRSSDPRRTRAHVR